MGFVVRMGVEEFKGLVVLGVMRGIVRRCVKVVVGLWSEIERLDWWVIESLRLVWGKEYRVRFLSKEDGEKGG